MIFYDFMAHLMNRGLRCCAVLLCTQKFNFKSWRTLIILLSGVLFMFLFFLALVIGYGVVYLVFLRKKMIAVLFTICFTLFYVQTKEAPVLYNILWQRFEWDETNHKFKEDNRENDAVDKFYDELKKSFLVWFSKIRSRKVLETSRGDIFI